MTEAKFIPSIGIQDPDSWWKLKERIMQLLDFNTVHYRDNFLKRRVEVRLRSLNITSYNEYMEYFSNHEDERNLLLKELTIHVTHFFRDYKLYRKLMQSGTPAVLTHEPGGTGVGERIARLLKQLKEVEVAPLTELLLFNASRAQLVAEVIKPALESGKVVICDRYADSTTAYQGYGRGLDLSVVAAVNNAGTLGLAPDLTILLDMPVEEGLARKKDRKQDRFEGEDKAFHQRVREGYLKLATDEPQRWLVIDAAQSKEKIAEIIWQRVSELLSSQKA